MDTIYQGSRSEVGGWKQRGKSLILGRCTSLPESAHLRMSAAQLRMHDYLMRTKVGVGRTPIHIARFLFSLVRCWVARRQTKQCLNITTLFLAHPHTHTQGRRFNIGPTRVTTGNADNSWRPTIRASQYPPRCNLHRHVNALSGCFRLQVPKEQKHCRRSHPSIPGMDSNSRALG